MPTSFNLADRVRELERELLALRSQLGRLPTRPAHPQLRASVIRCQAAGAISGGTGSVDNMSLLTGVDPRDDPDSASETLTISNPASLTFSNDDWLFCFYNETTGNWEPLSNAAGSSSGAVDIVHFSLDAELTLAATSVSATVITSTIGTSGTITVYDEEAKFAALSGYKGYAYYDGSEFRILYIEALARFADATATADSSATTETITVDLDHLWGNPPHGKSPAATTSVTVYKTAIATGRYAPVRSGDPVRVIWDEVEEKWKLFWYPGLRITVRKSTTDGVSGSTYAMTTGYELVNGLVLPTGTLTIQNDDPPIVKDAGSSGYLYARYNASVGTTPDTNWDFGDGGNWEWVAKGIGSYDASKVQVIYQNADGDLEWLEVEEIDVVTDITSMTIAGGNLQINFQKGTYKILKEVSAPSADTATIGATTSCP